MTTAHELLGVYFLKGWMNKSPSNFPFFEAIVLFKVLPFRFLVFCGVGGNRIGSLAKNGEVHSTLDVNVILCTSPNPAWHAEKRVEKGKGKRSGSGCCGGGGQTGALKVKISSGVSKLQTLARVRMPL